ncbi:hypothetical protein C451_08790 [Halococcus thailandensis JCM 13552]|uniref:Uncharacterized protein n=1 Tax=Halococcus thailandensis JCM 13552 TaxID=1227457 RepID=M0N7K9_9EURY|nr:hypothetical protein C451_08790 [Halococcus thailandensis JCM 13552]
MLKLLSKGIILTTFKERTHQWALPITMLGTLTIIGRCVEASGILWPTLSFQMENVIGSVRIDN